MLRDGRRGASPLRTRHLVRGEREKSRIPSSFPFHLPRGTNASWRVEASKSRTNRHVVPRERICSVVGFRASRPRVRAQRLRSRQREVKESGELLVVACLAREPDVSEDYLPPPFLSVRHSGPACYVSCNRVWISRYTCENLLLLLSPPSLSHSHTLFCRLFRRASSLHDDCGDE